MATAKPKATYQPGRWLRNALLLLVAAALAALAWYWRPLNARAEAGAAYGARMACACRFVAGRDLASCRDDFEPGMGLVMLSENVEARSVTATFPLLSRQTAWLEPGAGCVLEPWRE